MSISHLPEPLTHCPFCATAYLASGVRLVSQREGHEISHASCLTCLRAMLFAVERRGSLLACVGVLTDCDATEAVRFEKGAKISLDEVLKAHVELRK